MTAPAVTLRFDAVFYSVTDLDRSVAFYRDVLGLSLRSRDVVARFDVDGVLLELVPGDRSATAGGGNARVCFAVDDVEAVAALLGRRGVAVGPVRTVSNGRMAAFPDPDGNELVLWQYASGPLTAG
jgi:catechol 2,3-dioxygenase-like lactoylglutathione lyase family enzyme